MRIALNHTSLRIFGLALTLAACGSAEETAEQPEATESEAAQADQPVEATSLFGTPLVRPVQSDEVRMDFEDKLAVARQDLSEYPDSALAQIWVGRRLAYLGRYGDAIHLFTQGAEQFPDDSRFLRHRGHRFISTRQFDRAVEDLSAAASLEAGRADRVEPDGLPNARGIPTSTTQFNIHYHLGLAHYLQNDLEAALAAFRDCLAVSTNPDAQVATRHWLYMILRRLDREDEAAEVLEPVTADMDIIENQAYHDLLLLYRGERQPEDLIDLEAEDPSGSARWYGVANWYAYNGDQDQAVDLMRRLVAVPGQWAAFGVIAAEADLARWGVTPEA